MPNQIHCSVDYHQFGGEKLVGFSTGVKEGIKDNPVAFNPADIPAPPVDDAVFLTYINALETTFNAYKRGGQAQKPAYSAARHVVILALDVTADYVDVRAAGNPDTIVLAGYKATNSAALEKETLAGQLQSVTVTSGESTGRLNAECESLGHDHHYGCIVSEGQALGTGVDISPLGQLIISGTQPNRVFFDFNRNRRKQFAGLTKGTDYFFYFFAGNAAGVGPLSVSVSKMSL